MVRLAIGVDNLVKQQIHHATHHSVLFFLFCFQWRSADWKAFVSPWAVTEERNLSRITQILRDADQCIREIMISQYSFRMNSRYTNISKNILLNNYKKQNISSININGDNSRLEY